jgi:hypothetical protein
MAQSPRLSPRKRYTFWIDDRQSRSLEAIRRRDGVLPSEQIRRALDEWFAKSGVKSEAARKRETPRKRA